MAVNVEENSSTLRLPVLMRVISAFDRMTPAIQVANAIGATVLALVVGFTFVDVILRYFFNRPIGGGTELVSFGMIFIVFLGGAYCQLQKTHVGVDVVVNLFPKKIQVMTNCITHILYIGTLVLLIIESTLNGLWIAHKGQMTTNLLIPIAPVSFIVPLGCFMLLIVVLGDTLKFVSEGWKLNLSKLQWSLTSIITVLLIGGMSFWVLSPHIATNPVLLGVMGIVIMLFFMFTNMPVAFVLVLIGFLGMTQASSLEGAFQITGATFYTTVSNYSWACMPFFILMGYMAFYADFARDLYIAAYRWFGRFAGGLAITTVAACTAMGAVVGDVLSATLAMGAIALPEMRRYKYSDTLSAGVIAVGGTLGNLIPPSIGFIIYALLTNQSIGKLFISGIFPGILCASIWAVSIYLRCRLNPRMGPPGEPSSMKLKLVSLKAAGPVLVLFLLVIGGIYGGLFTPTEAGAIGAVGTLLIGLVMRRFTWKRFADALFDAQKTAAMSFFILGASMIFGYFMAASQLPNIMAQSITHLSIPPIMVIIAMLVILLVLGCVMPSLPMILITVPIFAPVAENLGFDLIWFGVLMMLMLNLATTTPPYGINLFVLTAAARDVKIGTIYKGVLPFVYGEIICVVIILIFPQIGTWLPSVLFK